MLEYVYLKHLEGKCPGTKECEIQIPNLITVFHMARSKFLKFHHSIKAVEGERFQHGTAGLLSNAGHAVSATALLRPRLDVHTVRGVHGRVLVKVVVGPQKDPTPVAHSDCVGDVLGVGDVKESCGHPGN